VQAPPEELEDELEELEELEEDELDELDDELEELEELEEDELDELDELVEVHTPPEQLPAHTCPQKPQFFGSLVVLAQVIVPEQNCSPTGHWQE
jgi:hypothetical protein